MSPLKYFLRIFILAPALMILSSNAYCQVSKKEIGCDLVRAFLDSLDNARRYHQLPKDSSLIFLDPDDLIKDCVPKHWNGYHITVVKQGSLIDSIKHFDPHFVAKGRCEYLLLVQRHDKKDFYLMLHHLCSNEESTATIKRSKGKYQISTIRYGVF